MATDGGAKDQLGSIGTTIEELWTGRGQVTGHPIHSFRRESVALLSLLVFLREYFKYFKLPPRTTPYTIFTDSESLILRVARLSTLPTKEWWSGVWIWPDIDTTAEICEMQAILPFTYKLEYVPSHQDNETPFNQLTREAQLNVLADAEATRALQEADPTRQFLAMPSCPVYMTIDDTPITSKELNACQNVLPHKRAVSYYQHRYNWTTSQTQAIDWEAFRAARRATPSLKTFIPKLCAKALPTNKKLAQREGVPAQCHFCHSEESNSHLWLCSCRSTWRTSFQTSLEQHLHNTHTTSPIRIAILDLLTRYFHNPQHMAYDWHGEWMLRGFLPRDWSIDQPKPQEWSKQLIMFIWNEIQKLWQARNDGVHANNESYRSQQDSIRAETAMKAFYQYEQEVGAQDRTLFCIPWQERITKMTAKEALSWIKNLTPAVMKARAEHQLRSQQGMRDIRSYFQSTSNQPAA